MTLKPPGQKLALDFDVVFAETSPFVWRVLARLGVASPDLPDVCQDVFVTVYRKSDDFDGRAALRSWIYGICLRTASDYRRRVRLRREEPENSLHEPFALAQQDEEVERSQARARVDSILKELDENQRETFILYELEELPMSEIAEALGCPLQTAYSRLHAARRAVTAAFDRPNVRSTR